MFQIRQNIKIFIFNNFNDFSFDIQLKCKYREYMKHPCYKSFITSFYPLFTKSIRQDPSMLSTLKLHSLLRELSNTFKDLDTGNSSRGDNCVTLSLASLARTRALHWLLSPNMLDADYETHLCSVLTSALPCHQSHQLETEETNCSHAILDCLVCFWILRFQLYLKTNN